jgi:hypothetical protein
MPESNLPRLQWRDLGFQAEEIVGGSAHDGQSQAFGRLAAHLEDTGIFLLNGT